MKGPKAWERTAPIPPNQNFVSSRTRLVAARTNHTGASATRLKTRASARRRPAHLPRVSSAAVPVPFAPPFSASAFPSPVLATRAAIVGRSVRATSKLVSSENVTARDRSSKSSPATPFTYTMGPNTLMVVRVDAVMAPCTSSAPRAAASTGDSPRSRCRNTFSSTTMELSTSMPTPRARPPRLMMFIETPKASIRANVPTTEMGMARATATG